MKDIIDRLQTAWPASELMTASERKSAIAIQTLKADAADEIETLRRVRDELAAQAQHLERENGKQAEILNRVIAERDELSDAFTVLWIGARRGEWDATAVQKFDALLERIET